MVAYKRFYKDDFEKDFINLLDEKLSTFNENKEQSLSIKDHIQNVLNTNRLRNLTNKPVVEPIQSFPSGLYSQKDLMNLFNIKHKVALYRKLELLGINKMELGNMVRYSKEEIDEELQEDNDREFLARMYITDFLHLTKTYGDKYILEIQKQALKVLEKNEIAGF
ncbi:hypothetical protein [Bacillus pinisoli]|uniref:hypothetical protein n=1 Tax=Bacillus pinisoli TaxID=2901866 RepID=UPI001FF5CF6D|nr:hypothetical protein [Bacillus pinisoli]